jgi:hypothetical protein
MVNSDLTKRNMMMKVLLKFTGLLVVLIYMASCSKPLMFPDTESSTIPQLKSGTAEMLWIGPEYKVVVQATLEDKDGISKVNLKNGELLINADVSGSNQTSYVVNQTFIVAKDANPTQHKLELTITNNKGGVAKATIDIQDLTATNQISGYNPDLAPPVINVTKPTVTKFSGLTNDPINIDVEAGITDGIALASIEVKVWGETATGEAVSQEELITPTPAPQTSYAYKKTFSLPAGKVGEYQYLIKATDASGNKAIKSGVITVGFMDKLYLSDAETEAEVINQAFDNYGNSRGIGTLISMKKQGSNTFVADVYYRNESSDNIRFVAFLGTDAPFITNQSKVNYTLSGSNVLGMSATEPGKITTNLAGANFKLPTAQKGYYRVTVDMTKRTVSVAPLTLTIPTDALKYPGYSAANPWTYMAATGPTIVGSANGYTEVTTSPKLMKEANHAFLYTGTFQTNGASANMSLNAPLAFVNSNYYGMGWFRLIAARAAMTDDYGALVDKIGPVGASGNGANYGFSLLSVGTYKATYDIALQRLRLVRIGN